jgi:hypothetical protein
MKKDVIVIMFLFLAVVAVMPQSSPQKRSTTKLEPAEELLQLFKTVLKGKQLSEIRESLSPEAYVINSNTYESIYEVLSKKSKKESFINGKELKTGFVHIRTSDDEKIAYMVAEVKSPDGGKSNWHSLLFKQNDQNKWQIVSWHKS